MRVRMLTNCVEKDVLGGERAYVRGEIVDLPKDVALYLIEYHLAVATIGASSPAIDPDRSRKDLNPAPWSMK